MDADRCPPHMTRTDTPLGNTLGCCKMSWFSSVFLIKRPLRARSRQVSCLPDGGLQALLHPMHVLQPILSTLQRHQTEG